MSGDKAVTLSINEQVTIRMALNDRLRWLTTTLRLTSDDQMVKDAVALLAKLDAIPIQPV